MEKIFSNKRAWAVARFCSAVDTERESERAQNGSRGRETESERERERERARGKYTCRIIGEEIERATVDSSQEAKYD